MCIRDRVVPWLIAPVQRRAAESGGVGEDMPDGNVAFGVDGEFRNVAGDKIIEIEQSALPKLADRHRRDRLGAGKPEHHRIGRHLHTRPG